MDKDEVWIEVLSVEYYVYNEAPTITSHNTYKKQDVLTSVLTIVLLNYCNKLFTTERDNLLIFS